MPLFPRLSVAHRFRARVVIWFMAPLLLALVAPCRAPAGPGKTPNVAHPIVTPRIYTEHGRCVNCGMKLNMWARTRHFFTGSGGEYHVCSIHCVAEIARQNHEMVTEVKVAVYLEPETMIAADRAFYLVGSTANGTMSAVSKIAFASLAAAQAFGAEYGGTVLNFAHVLALAEKEL